MCIRDSLRAGEEEWGDGIRPLDTTFRVITVYTEHTFVSMGVVALNPGFEVGKHQKFKSIGRLAHFCGDWFVAAPSELPVPYSETSSSEVTK